jgi:hypothetical protein
MMEREEFYQIKPRGFAFLRWFLTLLIVIISITLGLFFMLIGKCSTRNNRPEIASIGKIILDK